MPCFYVEWSISLDAETAEEAARKALKIHRDPESIVTVFHIVDENGDAQQIDLTELDETTE